MKEIKELLRTIGLNKESKFIVIFTERECVVFIVFSPGGLSVLLCPVTGDTVPYLKCSGGDYISHHNNMFRDCCFFVVESHLLDYLRVPVGLCVIPQPQYIIVSPTACVTNELAVFSVDIAYVHPHMTSQSPQTRILC